MTTEIKQFHKLNSNKSPTRLNNFPDIILTFIYSSACFGCSPAHHTHHQELNDCSSSLWFYLHIVVIAVLCSWLSLLARARTQYGYHHDTKVKPEAATAVIELLMMGRRTPKTCWAVNKHWDNKLENCCMWLVIYLNCTMMHGLTNLKFISWTVQLFWIVLSVKDVISCCFKI